MIIAESRALERKDTARLLKEAKIALNETTVEEPIARE